MKVKYWFILSACCLLAACTPKVPQTTTETPNPTTETPVEPDESLSKCKNWNNAGNQSDIMAAHVLYKDGMKEARTELRKGASAVQSKVDSIYKVAFDYWTTAYELAPAADGKRADHFEDGIRFYEHFMTRTDDKATKEAYVDTIMTLYDKRAECYGEEAYIMGRKAFDYYYKYSTMATEMEKYKMFKQAIDMDKENTQYFILNPFTALLSNMLIDNKIPMPEAQEYQAKIRESLRKGLADCKDKKACEPWKIVEEYVPEVLAQLDGVKDFYDCDYYKNKYYQLLEDAPEDCEAIVSVLGRLKWGGCAADDPQLMAANSAWNTHCKPSDPTPTCGSIVRDGNYREAIECYREKAEESADQDKKAQYYLFIAKIYYGELKRYGESRKYARLALKADPNMGAAYILIGKLYASSGPLCGPGRGWDSQIVTWPAIDKWNRAKQVDSSVASEANRLINTYSKFMPDITDIFQRGLKEGTPFTVNCWIQEKTIIRAAK